MVEVEIGEKYNFDVVVEEFLGEEMMLGIVLIEFINENFYIFELVKFKLEILFFGGIFKIGEVIENLDS